jgi:uncharacterized iron-regulated protein
MPRRQKTPDGMTVEEELQSLLKWAKRSELKVVAADLRRRILAKLKTQAK